MATQLAEEFNEPENDQELEQQSQAGGDNTDPEPSMEQAKRLGWKPEDEFKGDKSQWRDWQEFLDENLSNAPQLKATVKLLKRRIDQADRRYKKLETTLEEAKEYFSKAEQSAYDRAVADIKAKQRAAVALADEDAYDEADEELRQLEKDAKAGKPAKAPEVDPEVAKTFRKWERDNDWYGTNDVMTAAADAIAKKMGSYSDNDMDPDEYLEELTARVKKEFPHKFELPKKRSAVEGVSETRPTKGLETFENLPAEARQQFQRFMDMGVPVKKDVFAKQAWDKIKKEGK